MMLVRFAVGGANAVPDRRGEPHSWAFFAAGAIGCGV
jgi:hypothetical protein